MTRHEKTKRRGRPPLDQDNSSVSASLKLPARQYDEIYQRASRDRVSVPGQIRREMREKGDRST